MVYIIANTKGGVGKSLTSVVMASILHMQGKKFKLIEIDNSQDSTKFEKSEFLSGENAVSFTTAEKEDAMSDLFFDLLSDPSLDYIVDIGGGDDTKVVEMLKEDDKFEKTFIIPTLKTKKYIQNADNTFELINDFENTIFLLNGYHSLDDIEKEFVYFFGDSQTGTKVATQYFDRNRYLAIPDSNAFDFAEDLDQTILDLAMMSIKMTESEANDQFFKQAEGDRNTYKSLRAQYQKSKIARDTLNEISNNFQILF